MRARAVSPGWAHISADHAHQLALDDIALEAMWADRRPGHWWAWCPGVALFGCADEADALDWVAAMHRTQPRLGWRVVGPDQTGTMAVRVTRT